MRTIALSILISASLLACQSTETSTNDSEEVAVAAGQESVVDDVSEKDVVKVAVGSPDHTMGHEREVLLQRDSKFELIEVSENGYSPCVKLWEIT